MYVAEREGFEPHLLREKLKGVHLPKSSFFLACR